MFIVMKEHDIEFLIVFGQQWRNKIDLALLINLLLFFIFSLCLLTALKHRLILYVLTDVKMTLHLFPLSLRRVYVINKEVCVRTVCAHEELLRGEFSVLCISSVRT